MNIIRAPENSIYLGDFLQELPKGILNKKATGCGATTLALEDQNPTVLVSPLRELIDNKVAQYPNNRCSYKLMPVYAGITDEEIRIYLKDNKAPKLLVTYDSFHRLSKLIDNSFRIVVDEYQELLKAYSFRDKAIDSLIKSLEGFNYVTYLSATPIAPEYTPEALEKLPYTEVIWENTVAIKPIRFKTNKPYNAVVNIINRYKAGEVPTMNGVKSKEAFFFINSVKAIADIIENAGLKQSEVKIVCSDSSENRRKLGDIEINKALDENKQFTFITSTAFVGSDFYSPSGVVFVVSNCQSSTTLLDISTDIYQIAGRIRNLDNPFKNIIYHIYNTNTAEKSAEEFKASVDAKVKATKSLIKDWDIIDPETRNWMKKKVNEKYEDDYAFFDSTSEKLIFNELRMKNELFRFNIINNLYLNGISIREAYVKAGFDVSTVQQYARFTEGFIENATRKISFVEKCREYVTNYSGEPNLFQFESNSDDIQLINKALSVLGADRIKALGYQESKIKKALLCESSEAKNAVFYELKKQFEFGQKVTNADLKIIIQGIYNKLNIKKTAKATDIKEYYETKPTQITINGARKNGLEIKLPY